MPDYTTETQTFVGEAGTLPHQGLDCFCIGQAYELRIERFDNLVVFELLPGLTEVIVVSTEQFERWFKQ